MSRLEQANMNQMGALVLGKPTLLRTIDQWLLSSLLCLITIRLEFTDPQMQAVPVQDRRALMKTGAPPHDTWRIWIANYAGDNPEDHWTRHLGMQLVSSPNEVSRPHKCNAQTTTIVIGKLCAHIASSSVVPVPLGYTGVELANIWPDCHIDLDSGFLPTLTDAEVVHLHESWAASFRAV